ncbi:hypothetical protein DPMN_155945 [Dreissena polymorpha]|uniref:Uncharacterized protein n=1 Tax=Dreissena polymorpha TaxID=45954 RepID=A0A9D4FPS6_DREPO|nr:hypothetical protein DPMN_155945 [Dreissena polymorpha]
MAEREQMDFALKSGILSATRSASTLRLGPLVMFIHLSIQEFLAAYHIARKTDLIDDVISGYLTPGMDVYDISQVFIFLCGLDKSAAEKLSSMMNKRIGLLDSSEFQDLILAGYREVAVNGHTDIPLEMSHFNFFRSLDHNIDLYRIWLNNASNALSLTVRTGKNFYENKGIPASSHMKFDLSSCRKLNELDIGGNFIFLNGKYTQVHVLKCVYVVLSTQWMCYFLY